MRAIVIDRFGGPEELHLADVSTPVPGPGEILVKVAYAGVNPVDFKMRDGSSKFVESLTEKDFPYILGREMSGRVAALGEGVTADLTPGSVGFAFAPNGCYAEYVTIPAPTFVKAPDGAQLDVLAGLSIAGLTALECLRLARLTPSDVLLIHGAGGGVGQIVTQLAVATGATVYACASTKHTDNLVRWGAIPVDYTTQDPFDLPHRPNVIIDGVYFGTYEPSVAHLQPGERLVVMPTLANLIPAQTKGLDVAIPTISPDPTAQQQLAQAVADETLEVVVSERFALEQAANAHRLIEGGHAQGKVVLTVDPSL